MNSKIKSAVISTFFISFAEMALIRYNKNRSLKKGMIKISQQQKRLLSYGIFFVSIIILLTIFLPLLRINDSTYAGYEVAFGKELIDIDPFGLGSIASARLPISFFAIIAFFLPIIGGIIGLFSRGIAIVSGAFFLIAFVLFLVLPNEVVIAYTIAGTTTTTEVDWSLAFGGIIAAIASAIGAGLSLVFALKK